MKGLSIILIVMAVAIGVYFTSSVAKFLGIPPFIIIGAGLAFGVFATLFLLKYVKDIL